MQTMESETFVEGSALAWETTGEGIERQILGYDAEVMMVRVRFRAGAVGSRHNHPHRQVTYVEAGSFDVEIDGETRTLRAGDSFIVAPDLWHGVKAVEDGALLDVFAPARRDFLS
jgi:quercetin dioxygenase-like cupin family protein